MTKTKSSWEKRFEERFYQEYTLEGWRLVMATKTALKDFISKAIEKAVEEERELVIGEIKKRFLHNRNVLKADGKRSYRAIGQNQFINRLSKNLDKLYKTKQP